MMKKILVLANDIGGLYKFRKELLEVLIDRKHSVLVVSPSGEYVDDITDIGCEVIIIDIDRHGTNPLNEIKLIHSYERLIRQIKPDIVFTYTIKPNVYGGIICGKLGIPYVVNITGLGTAVENSGLMQKITLLLYKKGLQKAQKVFFQNVENQEFMIKNNIINVPYDILPGSGVNLSQYTVLDYPMGETIDFLFVSRIMKEKGIDQYIEAAKVIRKKYPQTRFHICGNMEQDYSDVLHALDNDGTIIYHGAVKDMLPIYKISSCTIHPTYYPEGLSNVLLESCACGRPIITTNRSGCREVVDDGVNGYVVEEKNSKDLIEKIELFLGKSVEERKQMGLAGRAKVEKEFNRQIVIDKYLGELDRI